jgi:hypothetical protein
LLKTEVFRFYVLHEFGHALGAGHEHQRLDCQWDYAYIAGQFGFATPAAARTNLSDKFGYDARAYPDIGAIRIGDYIATKYDHYSVMQYNLTTRSSYPADDKRVYRDGTTDVCYRSQWVSQLTPYDLAGMKTAYTNPAGINFLLASVQGNSGAAAPSVAVSSLLKSQAPGKRAPGPAMGSELTGLRKQLALVRTSARATKLLHTILASSTREH